MRNSTYFDYFTSELVYYLQVYYTFFLVVLGLVGNAISLLVFRCSGMWKLSTGRYLSALALTDSCFLVQLFVAWMDIVDVSDMFNWNGLCQASVYTSYVSCNLSAWLVVAFTVERLVAVKCPLRKNTYPASRATTVIQVLSGVSLTINLPVLRFATAEPHCNLDRSYWTHADAFNLLDTAISFTVPLAAIVVMNTLICIGLLRAHRHRQKLVPRASDRELRRGDIDRYKINAMLLTVSTVFVLLNLPAYSIRVLAYKFDLKGEMASERWITLQHVSLSMFHTNFGINILLYCLSGSKFRQHISQSGLWTRMRQAWRRAGARLRIMIEARRGRRTRRRAQQAGSPSPQSSMSVPSPPPSPPVFLRVGARYFRRALIEDPPWVPPRQVFELPPPLPPRRPRVYIDLQSRQGWCV